MKKKLLSMALVSAMVVGALSGCGSDDAKKGGDSSGSGGSEAKVEEGKVINIYSWNDEFFKRVNAVYDQVDEVSKDGTVTKLKDGTEIHWIINPNQDGV